MGKLDDLLDGKTVTMTEKDIREMVMEDYYRIPGIDRRRPVQIKIVFDGASCEARISMGDIVPRRDGNDAALPVSPVPAANRLIEGG